MDLQITVILNRDFVAYARYRNNATVSENRWNILNFSAHIIHSNLCVKRVYLEEIKKLTKSKSKVQQVYDCNKCTID